MAIEGGRLVRELMLACEADARGDFELAAVSAVPLRLRVLRSWLSEVRLDPDPVDKARNG